MKYHISKDGKMRLCRSKGNCPLGNSFENKSSATNYVLLKNDETKLYNEKIKEKVKYTEEEAAKRGVFVNQTVTSYLKNKLDTHSVYFNEEKQEYSKERAAKHRKILDELHEKYKDIPEENKTIFSAGLPGAGKTTVLNMLDETEGIKTQDFATVSSDDFKEIFAEKGMIPEVPGLDRMEASTLVHSESSYLADKFLKELSEKNKNVIYDFTCKNVKTTSERIQILKDSGYEKKDMQFVFVNIPLDTAKERAIGRYTYGLNESIDKEDNIGGRYLPPAVLEENKSKTGKYSSVNAETLIEIYNENKENGLLEPIVYDNSGNSKKDPTYKPKKINFTDFSNK